MDPPSMRPDCDRCAALCCVAPAFVPGPDFPIDKPNGEPCPNIADGHRCRIYADRERLGFSGCLVYDCLGAGQRVTQELFAGRSWRDEPELLAPMTAAFLAMSEVHHLLMLLETAAKVELPAQERRTLEELRDALTPPEGWTPVSLKTVLEGGLSERARKFFRSLRDVVRQPAP